MVYDYDVDNSISKIHVGSAIKLELSEDVEPGEFMIETYGNIFQYINVNMNSNKLSIWLDNKNYKGDIDIKVYASSQQYNSIEASGASTVSLTSKITASSYDVKLSGASKCTMHKDSDNLSSLSIEASGASKAIIKGSASKCNIEASGASAISGAQFTCEELDVDLSGASDLVINITKIAKGSLSGASILRYGGSEEFKIETSGASSIVPL